MATIKLLGELGRRFGREFPDMQVTTPVQALQLLACQLPGFTEFLNESEGAGIYWRVVTESPEGLGLDELGYPIGSKGILIIAPQINLSGGFGKILLGVALIGAAFLVPGGFLGLSPLAIGLMGASLVLSGVSQLITPKNKTPKDSDRSSSFLFDQASETTQQGQPIPILVGERYCTGFVVLSSGLSTNEIPL